MFNSVSVYVLWLLDEWLHTSLDVISFIVLCLARVSFFPISIYSKFTFSLSFIRIEFESFAHLFS